MQNKKPVEGISIPLTDFLRRKEKKKEEGVNCYVFLSHILVVGSNPIGRPKFPKYH